MNVDRMAHTNGGNYKKGLIKKTCIWFYTLQTVFVKCFSDTEFVFLFASITAMSTKEGKLRERRYA